VRAGRKRKGVARTPPYPKYPDWSSAKYYGFLRSNLRKMWQKWPPRWKLISRYKRAAEDEWEWEYEDGSWKKHRCKYEVQCKCGEWWPQAFIEVDHITPVGSLRNHADLAGFVERLLCSEDELQLMCKACHAEKTQENRGTNSETTET